MNEFVAGDPWFAGWCGAMVNISDIAAMGGRPSPWSMRSGRTADKAAPMLQAESRSEAFGVPVVGGHTNMRTDRGQLSVAILGRAKRLLTTFDAGRATADRGDRPARPLPRAVSELGSRHRRAA